MEQQCFSGRVRIHFCPLYPSIKLQSLIWKDGSVAFNVSPGGEFVPELGAKTSRINLHRGISSIWPRFSEISSESQLALLT